MSDTRHQLHSVSDLYAADEIEVLLLEEIRDLEPPPSAYSRPEDIQDFEIAGSRTGGRTSSQSSEVESPGVHSTVHSWDSHINYHGHYAEDPHASSNHPPPWPSANQLVLYCDLQGHLKTATGIVRVMLLISSVACLVTLCSSGTAKVSLFMLPLVDRLRLMIFVAVFCLLFTSLLLFLDISHIVYLFPFNWAKLNAYVFTGMGVSYLGGSVLLVCSVWEYGVGGWVPRRTRSQLAAAAALGLACGLLALLLAGLSWIHVRGNSDCKLRDRGKGSATPSQRQLYRPVDNSSSSGVTPKERSPRRPPSWVVKNQQRSKKCNTNANDDDGNGNNNKYKVGNKKDHWASAKHHFLRSQDDDEDEENRKGGDANRIGIGLGFELGSGPKTRCVPRKLPLKTLNGSQLQLGMGISSNDRQKQTGQTMAPSITNGEFQNYWAEIGGDPRTALSINKNQGASGMAATVQAQAAWASQWQPTLQDDVQPCSSKTVDPYMSP